MLAEGASFNQDFVVGESEMAAFAELTGDRNPIHVSDDAARARGFTGRVVYGALLAGRVSRLIGMELPSRDVVWTGLEIQFHRPLYVHAPATLSATVTHVSEATGSVELKLKIVSNGVRLAAGKATLQQAS